MELLRANNADLTKKNRQFALQHTQVHARNQELLAEANERLGELQELRRVNQDLKGRIAEYEDAAIATEELVSDAQELVFILIEGRKWETRYYKIKRYEPLVKTFNDFAKYEQISLEKLTFMSKDKKVFYRGDQTAIEAGFRDKETLLVFYDI